MQGRKYCILEVNGDIFVQFSLSNYCIYFALLKKAILLPTGQSVDISPSGCKSFTWISIGK